MLSREKGWKHSQYFKDIERRTIKNNKVSGGLDARCIIWDIKIKDVEKEYDSR